MGRGRSKDLVKKWIERAGVREVTDTTDIRSAILKEFTKQLDGKLSNLQIGEMLVADFDFHIVDKTGSIRGGSGSQRNMPEYITWRSSVYERDAFTCQDCGDSGVRLEAHHIKPWAHNPELRFDVGNGVTLCQDCHKKKHAHLRLLDREAS